MRNLTATFSRFGKHAAAMEVFAAKGKTQLFMLIIGAFFGALTRFSA